VGSLLARLQIDDEQAASYLRSARHVRSLYQLVPGRTVRAVTTEQGKLGFAALSERWTATSCSYSIVVEISSHASNPSSLSSDW
jgi:hypothetical protein